MADVYSLAVGSTTVGANSRTVVATSTLGTPALKFYKVAAVNAGSAVDFSAVTSDSNFFKGVNSLQGFAEIYAAYPGTAGFIVVVHDNTANNGSAADWSNAEAAIKAAVGADTSATITEITVQSNGLSIA